MSTDRARDIPDLGDDRFEIIERIGAGGMGTVYRAIQKSVGRPVAIKVLAPEQASSASGVNRFVREANVISRLAHPNIVSVIDFGRDKQGRILMVMELLEGETLRQTMRRLRRVTIARAVVIINQMLAALRVAHASGIVHRDLKPENVFMCRVDGADLVKVLDFGVAKLVVADGENQTTAGTLIGTLKYMAPEQIAGDPPDPRVDLYATGVVLYEMLSGGLPYENREKITLLRSILNDPPMPIHDRAPELPRDLCAVVMRAVAKMPADRYQTADELRAALLPFAQLNFAAAVASGPASVAPQDPRPVAPMELPTRAERVHARAPVAGQSPEINPRADDSAISARSEYTPGPGLSASSRASRLPTRRSGLFIAAIGLATVVTFSSIGFVLVRKSSGPVRPPPSAARAIDSDPMAAAPVVAPAALHATMVLVRTEPPGAVVVDTDTGESLCTGTPCAVAVPAGHARRVTLRNGELSVQTLLESSLAPVFFDLRSAGPPVPIPIAAQTPQAVDTPSQPAAASSHSHGSRSRRSNHGVQMFGPRHGGGVPMFAPPSR